MLDAMCKATGSTVLYATVTESIQQHSVLYSAIVPDIFVGGPPHPPLHCSPRNFNVVVRFQFVYDCSGVQLGSNIEIVGAGGRRATYITTSTQFPKEGNPFDFWRI